MKRAKNSLGVEIRHRALGAAIATGLGVFSSLPAMGANLTIAPVDENGAPVQGFKWLIEEDTTYQTVPDVHTTDTLSLGFHRSHTPVVMSGTSDGTTSTATGLDPNKHYFVSVLPYTAGRTATAEKHGLGGAPVHFNGANAANVSVQVHSEPVPTGQLSVLVFEDNEPINGAVDEPQERGLGENPSNPNYDGNGFKILLFDAGGQYGIAGGQMMNDAYGNPLGTEYDANLNVVTLGDGFLRPDINGHATIKNLAPGKYTVQVVPPETTDPAKQWIQTSTIEGTHGDDAWIKANEPAVFAEFGPPGVHVFVGFTKRIKDTTALNGTNTITGRVVNNHMTRPPEYGFYDGAPVPGCWVGLNNTAAGGRAIFAAPCAEDSTFSIPNVPNGSYQLVMWDEALDRVIAYQTVNVTSNPGTLDLGNIAVFDWFHHLHNYVFYDTNENGIRDAGEAGIPNVNVNIRFRDGRIYASAPTDRDGFIPFDETFPFFHWLVAEVDYSRFKATGATVTVDDGGPVDPNDPSSFEGLVTPQPQSENGGGPNRTELSVSTDGEYAPVLLEAFQGFLGQTNVIEWGKVVYPAGENGGISGIVYYATTRAEDDPRYAAAEVWEPGIPHIRVNLYKCTDATCGTRSLVNAVTTDSWDDNLPSGCQGTPFVMDGQTIDCYDGLRNFNQVRPGLFDGGYMFLDYFPGGGSWNANTESFAGNGTSQSLTNGYYVVEVVPPSGYKIVKEEDRNVDIGSSYTPSPLLLPPECVGAPHLVPSALGLQTYDNGNALPGIDTGDLVASVYAGQTRPLCDQKKVVVQPAKNTAADFFLFTDVPRAAHLVGGILNDLANEFDPNAPNFGEKYAPPWLPVSIRDWTGKEITRFYADEWGKFNGLVPSTYSINVPMPSGVSPNMLSACMNDAGAVRNPNFNASDPNSPPFIVDPHFDPQYSQFCYTLQYMPGATTYLDTPVLPVAAFAGPGEHPLDCEQQDGTPEIYSVQGPYGGPLARRGSNQNNGDVVTIVSAGTQSVKNPLFGTGNAPKNINRNFGFGTQTGRVTYNGQTLPIVSWSNSTVTVRINGQVPTGSGELLVSRANGATTPVGVTLTVLQTGGSLTNGIRHVVPSSIAGAHPIQDAIDAAGTGDLILIHPGAYDEMVVMSKPVRLQGSGARSTIINARNVPNQKLPAWDAKIDQYYAGGGAGRWFDFAPGQTIPAGGAAHDVFVNEQGAGITVLARSSGNRSFNNEGRRARIDGLGIMSATGGGGIFINAYADYLEVSNNRIVNNQGDFGGGIRVGNPDVTVVDANGVDVYSDASNDNLSFHHNHLAQNGTLAGVGGGLSLYTGTDNYLVQSNFICGNFAEGHGAGIGHQGVSNNAEISRNTIIFNQSFSQSSNVNGGGIYIGGAPSLAAGLSDGSGNVLINRNLIQGNQAGAGDGGGISLESVNGTDITDNQRNANRWYHVDVLNNIIVNNMAGFAAGGISMQDTVLANIVHNTIANNDSTATVGTAFIDANTSAPLPAGVVSRVHSSAMLAALAPAPIPNQYEDTTFGQPNLQNDIIWHNRSFFWRIDNSQSPAVFGLVPNVANGQAPVYNDLGVIGAGAAARLDPRNSLLTSTAGYNATNRNGNPQFVAGYQNGDRGQTVLQAEATTAINTAAAFDEGGNFIDVRFGPLTLSGNYHIGSTSNALNGGSALFTVPYLPTLATDFDAESRPFSGGYDMGADERH